MTKKYKCVIVAFKALKWTLNMNKFFKTFFSSFLRFFLTFSRGFRLKMGSIVTYTFKFLKKDRFQSWRTANYIGMAYNTRMGSHFCREDDIYDKLCIFFLMVDFVKGNIWYFKSLSWGKKQFWRFLKYKKNTFVHCVIKYQ